MSAWTDKMHARAREATEIYYPDSLHKAFLFHALDEIERLRAENTNLLAEVDRLRIRASLADAMIERVARDTAAKEAFTGQRQWEDLADDERTYLREHARRVLAADLAPKKNTGHQGEA